MSPLDIPSYPTSRPMPQSPVQGEQLELFQLRPDPYSSFAWWHLSGASLLQFPDPPFKLEEAVQPKIVASFVGRVESVNENSARVILVNQETAERLESNCDVKALSEDGLTVGDEFRCEIESITGAATARVHLLPPKPLSNGRIQQILTQFRELCKL